MFSLAMGMMSRGRPSNLELAMMLGNLKGGPNATTRPCTQCSRDVPMEQVLLTCDKCRASKKAQKVRRKERDDDLKAVMADLRGGGSTTSAPKKKAAPKKAAGKKRSDDEEESVEEMTARIMGEFHAAKGKAGAKGKAAATAGTKRRRVDDAEAGLNEPGAVYDKETAARRMRGDMPMPKLEPIGTKAVYKSPAESAPPLKKSKPTAAPAPVETPTAKPTPLTRQSSNLLATAKPGPSAKPQKVVQTSLAGFFKPTAKSA
ncbi:hypothetical protein C8R43DRAFT_1046947 [Mycena crocata]|nr:hypothetical protein C8R43DRAFT_1046947 [Mycena crocata]